MGDVVRATALLHGLRRLHPGAVIDWLVDKESEGLLLHNPFVRTTYVWGNHPTEGTWDVVVNLEDDRDSAAYATAHGRSIRGAFLKDDALAYTESGWFDMSLISNYGKERADELKRRNTKTYFEHMFELIGARWQQEKPIVVLTEDERTAGKRLVRSLVGEGAVVGVNPFAGTRWRHKSLPDDRTAVLLRLLASHGHTPVLFGEPARLAAVSVQTGVPTVDTSGSPRLLAAAVAACTTLITSDSLALHLATAVGTPIVAFFGPTSHAEVELFGGHKVVPDMKCLSCYLHDCDVVIPCSERYDLKKMATAVDKLAGKGSGRPLRVV